MSPKKIKRKKSGARMDSKPWKSQPLWKRVGQPLFWTGLIGIGLWALMKFSVPASQLEPYTPFQKTSATAEETQESSPPLDLDKISHESDPPEETGDLPAPGGNLPRKTMEHISRGIELTEQGKFNAGEMEFEKAAGISPNSPEVFSIWATALKMQKKYKGANKKFARAHELAPKDAEITFNWGMSALQERNSDEAIRLFKKTVELDPKHFTAYNYLGKGYGQKKLYDQEIESYRKAIALQPQFAPAYFNLGVVLSLQKKFEEAAPHFEKAIAIDKSFEKPFVIQLLTALGRYQPSSSKKFGEPSKKQEPVQEAKTVPAPPPEPTEVAKKPEKSGQKMEGSKTTKETTSISGKILLNGKPLSSPGVVLLETNTKLKVPGQKAGEFTIRQKDLHFLPEHTVIPVGSTVTFVNEDVEVHNIYSKSRNNQFNLGAMAGGASKSIKMTQAGPVVLRCNLHKSMFGTLFVVPNGYYAQPDAKGEYSFDHVKSQAYLLYVWHPRLKPEEVEANIKSVDLKGTGQTLNFDIKTDSNPGDINDLVDPIDYDAVVDNIEKELNEAVIGWSEGKKSIPTKRALMAVTKHYAGEGLKGAIAKSFSMKRSLFLEKKLDDIRKQIQGIGVSKGDVTEASLKNKVKTAISQLRNNVRELQARLNPDFTKK
ncbi:MAG: tetratricopeptide repeat protein [Nitrospinaceae bacterium]